MVLISYLISGLFILSNLQIVYEPIFKTTEEQWKQMLYLQQAVSKANLRNEITPLLLGQIQTESSWRSDAKNALGCVGLLQFCPQWNREFFERGTALDYRSQISEYLGRVKERLNQGQSIRQAVISHFSPRCRFRETPACSAYYRRIEKNSQLFTPKIYFKRK